MYIFQAIILWWLPLLFFEEFQLQSSSAIQLASNDKGLLQGVVLDHSSKSPIANATVSLFETTPPHKVFTARSDDQGRFLFSDLSRGRYEVSASGDGYISEIGKMASRSPGRVMVNFPQTAHVELRLRRPGAIRGRVINADKQGVAGVSVRAYTKRHYSLSKPLWSAEGSPATTARDGSFELTALPEGRYTVIADPNSRSISNAPSSDGLAYVRTLYPSVLERSHAQPIFVISGQTTSGIDVLLLKSPVFKVTGKIILPETSACNSVLFVNAKPSPPSDALGLTTIPQKNGEFTFDRVPAGPYDITASCGTPDGSELSASQSVVIDDRFQSLLTLHLAPTLNLKGKVSLPHKLDSDTNLELNFIPWGGLFHSGGTVRARVDASGAFSTNALHRGPYGILLKGLPPSWHIASLRDGARELNPMDFVVGSNSQADLTIEVAVGGTVTGEVKAAGDAISSPAYVVLCLSAELAKTDPAFRGAFTDDKGNFTFTGLAPGDYRVYAFTSFDVSIVADLLRAHSGSSKTQRVAAGETAHVSIPLI
jgi:hypothetical protein